MPENLKVYHIVHVDRLSSIIKDERLWCDAKIVSQNFVGTTIGMGGIKQRRLKENSLACYPDLYVGDCVPFYFCPRSVMLYIIYRGNHEELAYKGGQNCILHLEADLNAAITWAAQHSKRWAFTLSNAGSRYFEVRCDLKYLDEVDWQAVEAQTWTDCREKKQAEFLMENEFPWHLFERIGVRCQQTFQKTVTLLQEARHKPDIEIKPEWYY